MGKEWHLVSAEILKEEKVLFSLLYTNIHKPLEKHRHLLACTWGHVTLEASKPDELLPASYASITASELQFSIFRSFILKKIFIAVLV